MYADYSIFPLGDSALTIDFGNRIEEELNQKVLRLFHHLQNFSPYIKDVIPAYSSITVYYDVLSLHSKDQSAFATAKELILPLLMAEEKDFTVSTRQLRIPVCYAPKYGLDLEELATGKKISKEELIELHSAKTYRVYMIGFLPGFAYMGKVDERIATPRRTEPRKSIPAGAVGIAGEQTGIYPFASPGGWNIIGQTPLKLFDAERQDPALFQPGDEVRFYSITEHEFEDYQRRHS